MRLTTRSAIATALFLVLVVGCGGGGGPRWPAYTPDPRWKPLVEKAVADYTAQGTTYQTRLQNYTTFGDFLNFGATMSFIDASIRFDADGLPMVFYDSDNQFHYNPATIAIFGLWAYGDSLRGENTASLAQKAVDKLVSMQGQDGAFRYDFSFTYFRSGRTYQPGWVSCLPQGLSLSLFARMYNRTNNPQYLTSGDRALAFLLTPVGQGGVMDSMKSLDPSLSAFVFFDEFTDQPAAYTLDDFMYALLGLYDWSHVPSARQAEAGSRFTQGIDTLRRILPYYDVGGFSAYDLGHITRKADPYLPADFHAFHIAQLHALHSVTNEAILKQYETLWESYVSK